MSYENGGASKSYRSFIEKEFDAGNKLFSDSNTDWLKLKIIDEEDLGSWRPYLHYEERFRAKHLPEDVDLIMKRSDPQSVTAFDQLVDEFNTDLERIKKEKDLAACRSFAARARKIIYTE